MTDTDTNFSAAGPSADCEYSSVILNKTAVLFICKTLCQFCHSGYPNNHWGKQGKGSPKLLHPFETQKTETTFYWKKDIGMKQKNQSILPSTMYLLEK